MPCLFCQADATLTAEHVIPEWAREHLQDDPTDVGTHIRQAIHIGTNEVVTNSYEAVAASAKTRCVCARCNNGWMSDLESKAKPLLGDLIDGRPRAFTETQREIVATWFVKTAFVQGAKFPPSLPRGFYHQLYRDRLPSEDTRVWLFAVARRNQTYIDYRHIYTYPSDEQRPDVPNAFSSVVSVGRIGAFVLGWTGRRPPCRELMSRWGEALIAVWPISLGIADLDPNRNAINYDRLDALADAVVAAPIRSFS